MDSFVVVTATPMNATRLGREVPLRFSMFESVVPFTYLIECGQDKATSETLAEALRKSGFDAIATTIDD